MNKIVLTLLSVFFSLSLYAQQNKVTIKGTLKDSVSNETIPFATVRIVEKTSPQQSIKAVATDDNGNFLLVMDRKGNFILNSVFIGKISIDKEITIADQKTINLGAVYMKDDNLMLYEVVVTAQKPLVKVDLDKIIYSLQDDPESKTNNVLEMLKKVPMITVDGEDNIQLKGSGNFKIYMNGKPSNMISNNPKEILKSMPANTIKDIEVITDPGAKYDAEGVAGIINIITDKNSQMGGFTGTFNAGADTRGGFNGGGYVSLKYGKIGFTGNYNYYDYKVPRGAFNSYTDDYTVTAENRTKYTSQNGSSKNNGHGQFGSGEFSFELDTLNLINVNFDIYNGKGKANSDFFAKMQDINHNSLTEYESDAWNKYTYGNTTLGVDYQRTFAGVKDRLFTASYRLSLSPNDSESESDYTGIKNFANRKNTQYSDADMNEHTFQVDFTTPFAKIHTFETGLKYILRINKSNSGISDFDSASNSWIDRYSDNNEFKHTQDILAAYAGYNLKYKKWGFKAGLRYEATWLNAKFPLNTQKNFDNDYSNLVPSATVTYQINPMQNLRAGYNMSIRRPGIWQLNPYSDSSDTLSISKGNPDLDAVKYHDINLNYSYFNPKFNMNANMSYNFANNTVQDLTTMNNGVKTTMPSNIGESKDLYLSIYLNWSPNQKLRLYSNLGGSYTDIKANDNSNLKNHGFHGDFYLGGQYTLPWNLKFNASGGYYSPSVNLLGKGTSYQFHSFAVSKSFLSDKLNIRIYASSLFKKNLSFENKQTTPTFYSWRENVSSRRHFGFYISYRFGEMKSQIKKAKRTISNDDSMGNGSAGGAQGGAQGAGQVGGGGQ